MNYPYQGFNPCSICLKKIIQMMTLIDEIIHYSILHIILIIKKMCYLSIRPLLKALDNFEHHHSISRKKLTYL